MNGQMPPLPNQQTSQQIEQPQVPTNQETPNAFTPKDKGNKKGLLFEIILVVIVLVLVFGALNYFNILRLSEIFPDQLGFLPRKDVPSGTSQQSQQSSNVTLSPNEQTKQTLVNFLTPILAPPLLVPSSDINLTQEKGNSERFIAQWTTKDGVVGISFTTSQDLKKIILLDFGLNEVQTTSWSEELGKSTIPQVFSIQPKGDWGCKPALAKRSYCENFWEEEDTKKGLGFLIIPTNISSRIVFSFCEHSKESNLYSWKSCRAEFAESGVE